MVDRLTYASVDDEPVAHDVLRSLMRAHADMVDVGRWVSPVVALKRLPEVAVDLLFVDIQMPQISGLQFLRQSGRQGLSVLLTAHAQHALEAFDLGVRDYLLKPLSPERLAQCLDRLRPLLEVQRQHRPGLPSAPLCFPVGREQRFVAPDEIVAIDADANFATLVTIAGNLYVSESLKSLESRLILFGFVRVHKGHLVNQRHLKTIKGDELTLRGDLKRPLGRAYRPAVEQLVRH